MIIYQIIANLIMHILWYVYFNQMLTPRFSRVKSLALFLFIFEIPLQLQLLTHLLPGDYFLIAFRLTAFIATGLLFVNVSFSNPLLQKCAVYLSLFVVMELGEATAVVVATLLGEKLTEFTSIQSLTVIGFITGLSATILVQASILLCIVLFWKRKIFFLKKRAMANFLIYPFSQLILLTCTFGIIYINTNRAIVVGLVIFLIVAVAADIALLFSIRDMGKMQTLELKNIYLEEQKNLQARHYQELQQQYSDIYKLRHDILTHLHTVQILSERGDLESAKQYADEVTKNYEQVNIISHCANPVIDALLCDKINYAKTNEINISTSILLPTQLDMPDTELVCILGNLLDNAIEASMLLDDPAERQIVVQIYLKFNNLVLIIENKCQTSEIRKPLLYRSRVPHYGLGQEIIKQIVDNHDGSFLVQHTSGLYSVHITIPIS